MTSVVTKMLIDLGFYGGDNRTDLLVRKDNALKYWEYKDAVTSDQAAFMRLRKESKSYNWVGYSVPWEVPSGDALWEMAVRGMSKLRLKSNGRPLIVKDPRMALVAAPWLKASEAPACLIMVRDPETTVFRFLADYSGKGGLSARQWGSVWEQYTWRALYACVHHDAPIVVVRHEDVASSLLATMSKLHAQLSRLGFQLRPMESAQLISKQALAKWDATQTKAAAKWVKARVSLPFVDRGEPLLSEQGANLWALLQKTDYGELSVFVRDVNPPQWVPLVQSPSEAYVTFIDNVNHGQQLALARVLARSILAHDSSRALYLLVPYRFAFNTFFADSGWELLPTTATSDADWGELVRSLAVKKLKRVLVVRASSVAMASIAPLFDEPGPRATADGGVALLDVQAGNGDGLPTRGADSVWPAADAAVARWPMGQCANPQNATMACSTSPAALRWSALNLIGGKTSDM